LVQASRHPRNGLACGNRILEGSGGVACYFCLVDTTQAPATWLTANHDTPVGRALFPIARVAQHLVFVGTSPAGFATLFPTVLRRMDRG